MKKEYNTPEMKIVLFANEDIMANGGITLSGVNPNDKSITYDWDDIN